MATIKPHPYTVTIEPGDLLTVEEYAALPDEPGWTTELVDGKVIRMPFAGYDHGRIVLRLAAYVGGYILAHDLGDGTTEQSGYNFADIGQKRMVRAPDFAFMSKERAAQVQQGELYPRIAPDLVAEVVSPSQNTEEEMRGRAHMWLSFGVRVVWVIWPDARAVDTWTPDDEQPTRTLETLEAPDVLPGFSLSVAKLFS